MKTAMCPLFEDYYCGASILAASLYQQGFRGDIWIGYRGTSPP